MRSTVGNLLDVDFQTYKANSRGKIPRGVYHYYWNSVSPVTQAQLCLSAIGTEKFEGRVWLDLETTTSGAYAGAANWKRFLNVILAAGLRVGIYTGYYWWKTYAVDTLSDIYYFAQYPLWQAWYTTNAVEVMVAKPWSSMMIWQDTSLYNGQNAGAEGTAIDRDRWNDLYSFINEWQAITPPPTGEPPMTLGTAREAKGNLASVRTAPDVSGAKIGTIAGGSTVNFMELVNGSKVATDKWLKLPDGISYVNQFVGGVTYFTILTMPSITPPPPVTTLPVLPVSITLGDNVTYAQQTVTVNLQPLK